MCSLFSDCFFLPKMKTAFQSTTKNHCISEWTVIIKKVKKSTQRVEFFPLDLQIFSFLFKCNSHFYHESKSKKKQNNKFGNSAAIAKWVFIMVSMFVFWFIDSQLYMTVGPFVRRFVRRCVRQIIEFQSFSSFSHYSQSWM